MKIGLVTTHNFPVPYKTHTGEIVIKDLAEILGGWGHEVFFIAPAGSYVPPGGHLLDMPCSWGKFPPASEECEVAAYFQNHEIIKSLDIIHDFSNSKWIARLARREGIPTISTFLGGNWNYSIELENICVWSESMRRRSLLGQTDYHDTRLRHLGGPNHIGIKEAHVVYLGVDTNSYLPSEKCDDYYLWQNRWHETKGYREAIEIAKRTGIRLILSGENPDNELFEHQRKCAEEARDLSQGYKNIEVKFLPSDPDHHLEKIKMYQKAKALLYTVQFQEPGGLSMAESLSCGTPILGTKYGSVPETVTHGVTGIICDNDISSLINGISKLDVIDRKICRSEAVRRFDRSIMAKKYIKEYEKILSGYSW